MSDKLQFYQIYLDKMTKIQEKLLDLLEKQIFNRS